MLEAMRSDPEPPAGPVNWEDQQAQIRLAMGTPPQVRRRAAAETGSDPGRLPPSPTLSVGDGRWLAAARRQPGRSAADANRFAVPMPTVVARPRSRQTKRHASCFTI